jgi:5-formaminoimidazole-4-carboxamide-1-(beta)-D-ribofuranosyl 5'-monophosphate synthetase
MLQRDDIAQIIEDYDRMKLRIGMTASHSALDICDGGIEEGFPTVAYCQEGRHKTYANYFKTKRSSSGRVLRGMVDKAIVMPSFNDVMNDSMQVEMRKRNVVYIPNRSFTSYSSIEDVENKFRVPLFGSRNMLRMEERTEEQDYYWILDKAGLPYPEAIENPEDIDCLTHKRSLNVGSSRVHPMLSTKRNPKSCSRMESSTKHRWMVLVSSGM